MQLQITLRPSRSSVLLTSYWSSIQGVIYQLLDRSDPQYSRFLHDEGYQLPREKRPKLKQFCFLGLHDADGNHPRNRFSHKSKKEIRAMFQFKTSLEETQYFKDVRAESLEKGGKRGLEKGEPIGEIRMSQKFLKLPQDSKETLFQKTTEELQKIHEDLEKQLDW